MGFTVNGQDAPSWTAVRVRPGDVIAFQMASAGCRAYLAVAGGIDVPPVLGSRATYLRGRLGGLGGRQLQKGDALPVGVRRAGRGAERAGRCRPPVGPTIRPSGSAASSWALRTIASRRKASGPSSKAPTTSRPQADRMGYRLQGPEIPHARGHDIVSDGIPLGGIQVPGERQPIVLLVDRQTTGGYTKIATVIGVDIGAIGQTRPGQRIRFRRVSLEEAHAARAAEARWLAHAIEGLSD